MRVDGVGVGDIGEVHGGTRSSRHASGGDDGRGSERELESGMVHRRGRPEHHATWQPGWHRIRFHHGPRIQHGPGDVHREVETGSDRMRVDGVGVGDLSEVSGRAWG
jgi:hypothetical protein